MPKFRVTVFDQACRSLDAEGNPSKPRVVDSMTIRAINIDEARKLAIEKVAASGRQIRSSSCTEEGIAVIVFDPETPSPSTRTLRASRLAYPKG